MKKIFLSICIIIFGITAHVSASNIKIYVDGVQLASQPVLEYDRVFVPVRSIFEYLDSGVFWNDDNDTILINSGNFSISLTVGSQTAVRNSQALTLDYPVKIINDRSYVPLRGAAQLLFCTTDWDGENRCVNIYKNTPPPVSDKYNYIYENEIFTLVNNIRSEYGLPLLEWDNELAFAARFHAEDMSVRNFFDHVNPNGKSPFERLKEFGINYMYAAENIAKGNFKPSETVSAWMDSQSHRANILNPYFSKMGIGFFDGYWVQEFSN